MSVENIVRVEEISIKDAEYTHQCKRLLSGDVGLRPEKCVDFQGDTLIHDNLELAFSTALYSYNYWSNQK